MTARRKFLEARAQGLGGSDAGALLQPLLPEVKYGCRRRLFYQKTKAVPDFDREETGPMRLGNILEPVLCEDFARETGRKIRVVGQQKHPDFPELVGHADRMQSKSEREDEGVLECKALGTRVFYETKRDGLIPDYQLQLQFYFTAFESKWGSFVVGNRDNLAKVWWDVDRNESICESIIREGTEFWKTLSDPDKIPERLEPEDRRCQRCEYRLTCHGSAFMETAEESELPVIQDLTPLASEYLERKKALDQATEAVDETKSVIEALLGENVGARVPVNGSLRPIYWRPQEGKPMYAEAVKSLGAQYVLMRDRLIELGAMGAELIPMPGTFIRKGKPSRPLMLQYLEKKEKNDSR